MKYILLAVALILLGCKAKQQVHSSNTLLEIAVKKLGAKLDSFPNSSGEFILYVQHQDAQPQTKMVLSLVIESKTGKIVAEESFMPGYIRWTDESHLEVLNAPGIIKADEDLSRYTKQITISNSKNRE